MQGGCWGRPEKRAGPKRNPRKGSLKPEPVLPFLAVLPVISAAYIMEMDPQAGDDIISAALKVIAATACAALGSRETPRHAARSRYKLISVPWRRNPLPPPLDATPAPHSSAAAS